jgi:hypothetical protein
VRVFIGPCVRYIGGSKPLDDRSLVPSRCENELPSEAPGAPAHSKKSLVLCERALLRDKQEGLSRSKAICKALETAPQGKLMVLVDLQE